MTSRRSFLIASAGAAMAPAAKAAPVQISTISMLPQYYHGWPTLARCASGDLIAVWSGGREAHVCPFGRVEMMRSKDDGATWSFPQVLVDTPIDDRDTGVCETAKGTLLVTTFTSLAYQSILDKAKDWPEEKLNRWNAVNRGASEADRKALLGTWMIRSTDKGLTWSTPYRVPVNSPHGPVPIKGGKLFYAGKKLWNDSKICTVEESSDDGLTWKQLAVLPVRPGDSVDVYHELHGIQAANGTLIVQIRNENKNSYNETLQTESTDGGKTWTMPHEIGVWGKPSHLMRLKDGRLLMTYGYRRKPYGNQARVSADHGKTWSEPITISDDGASGDLGYPSTVETASGQLLTLWYEKLASSPQAVLRLARWSL